MFDTFAFCAIHYLSYPGIFFLLFRPERKHFARQHPTSLVSPCFPLKPYQKKMPQMLMMIFWLRGAIALFCNKSVCMLCFSRHMYACVVIFVWQKCAYVVIFAMQVRVCCDFCDNYFVLGISFGFKLQPFSSHKNCTHFPPSKDYTFFLLQKWLCVSRINVTNALSSPRSHSSKPRRKNRFSFATFTLAAFCKRTGFNIFCHLKKISLPRSIWKFPHLIKIFLPSVFPSRIISIRKNNFWAN